MARSRTGSTDEAEDTTAVRPSCNALGTTTATALRARQGPLAASGGVLRPALTRAHAVVWRSYATKATFVASRQRFLETFRFLLDGGVQIRLLAST